MYRIGAMPKPARLLAAESRLFLAMGSCWSISLDILSKVQHLSPAGTGESTPESALKMLRIFQGLGKVKPHPTAGFSLHFRKIDSTAERGLPASETMGTLTLKIISL
jgi:hypothetical protein